MIPYKTVYIVEECTQILIFLLSEVIEIVLMTFVETLLVIFVSIEFFKFVDTLYVAFIFLLQLLKYQQYFSKFFIFSQIHATGFQL